MGDNHENDQSEDVETSGDSGQPAQDPIKNIKAEFDRKLGNVNEQLLAQQQAFQEVLKGLQAQRQPTQTRQTDDFDDSIEDLAISNPKKYAQVIKERTKQEVKSEIASELTHRDRIREERIQTANQMTVEYPELAKGDSELTVETMRILNSLDPSIRETGNGVRMAIREAAAKLGVVPVNHRQRSSGGSDDFTLSGKGSEAMSDKKRSDRQTRSGAKLSENAKAFAELVGINTKDPKVMERLEKRATRQNYKRYKGNE